MRGRKGRRCQFQARDGDEGTRAGSTGSEGLGSAGGAAWPEVEEGPPVGGAHTQVRGRGERLLVGLVQLPYWGGSTGPTRVCLFFLFH
jgi:hypothetical protein